MYESYAFLGDLFSFTHFLWMASSVDPSKGFMPITTLPTPHTSILQRVDFFLLFFLVLHQFTNRLNWYFFLCHWVGAAGAAAAAVADDDMNEWL